MNSRFDPKDDEIGIGYVIEFLLRNVRMVALFCVLVSGFTIWRFQNSPSFTAVSSIYFESSQGNAVAAISEKLAGASGGGSFESDRVIERHLLLISSRTFAEDAARILIKNNKVKELYTILGENKASEDIDSVASVFLGVFDAGRQGTDVIRLSVSHSTAEGAVRLTNLVADTVVAAVIDRNTRDIMAAKTFLQGQMTEIDERLRKMDDRIAAEQLSIRSAEYTLGAVLSRSPGEAASVDREIMELKRDLLETESLIAEARKTADSNETSPIDKYSSGAAVESLERKSKLLKLRIDTNQKVLEQVLQAAKVAPVNQGEIEGLFKKREVEYQMFAELKKEVMALNIQSISAENKVRVLEKAMPGSARSAQNLISTVTKRAVFAAVVALLIAFLAEFYDPVVRTQRDLAHLRLTFLGSLPNFDSRRNRLTWFRSLFDSRARTTHLMHSFVAEADSFQDIVFKNLRTRVVSFMCSDGKKPRVISVMSAASGEGKTSVAGSLARYVSMSGKRVLLIDGDLRKHSLSNALGFNNETGLTEYLLEPSKKFDQAVVRHLSERLDVLPAGHATQLSSELLSGEHFRETVEAMKHFYDYVILDTPPALPYSEVVPIAAVSDLVAFITLSHKTPIRSVEQTIEKLRFGVNTPIGLVLNIHENSEYQPYASYYKQGAAKPVSRDRAA